MVGGGGGGRLNFGVRSTPFRDRQRESGPICTPVEEGVWSYVTSGWRESGPMCTPATSTELDK